MNEQLIKPYEISVWEERLAEDKKNFVEKKIAVIGSNEMTGLHKVYNPVFNKKANGEKSLTFSLKYKYFNPYDGEEVINPFIGLLTNERKVKLFYDDKWYEFIVKDHTETSEEYEWEYVCTDAFVLELSKNGYNLTFDSELNNNQGTAADLVKKTIEDTDWRFGDAEENKQLVAEPMYSGIINGSIGNVLNTDTGQLEECMGEVYVFYSYIKNKSTKFIQFILKVDSALYTIDDKNVITATNYRIMDENLVVTDDAIKSGDTVLIYLGNIETKYQANRLVYNQLTTYDPVMERTVERFKAGDRDIYKYTDYAYTTSNVIVNYITNGENFNILENGTLQGWNPYVGGDGAISDLQLITRPELGTGKTLADINVLSQIEGFLKVGFKGGLTVDYKNLVYNSGIKDNSSILQSITKGEKFVFRWRAGVRNPEEQDETKSDVNCLVPTTKLNLLIARYKQDDPVRYGYYYKHIDPENIVLRFEGTTPKILNNIIKGGNLQQETLEDKYDYIIDGVVQVPSTKYIYEDNSYELTSDTTIVENKDYYKKGDRYPYTYTKITKFNGENPAENNWYEITSVESYVWNGSNGNFEPLDKNYSNYLPYYYLVAEATKPISNTILQNSSDRYGIFLYTTENTTNPFYIQDIQLIRFVADGADPTGQTPILIGNVPTATSNGKDYYYLKPENGMEAEDVETFADIQTLKDQTGIAEDIIPLYNENSEKYLSISAEQSNCFNILQTIAETFEYWIDLVVEHTDDGSIIYDEYGPRKFIYLRKYAGKDNDAGFKYGINLKSIERNVNSEEVVTKLIVDQSQSDYVDDGYISIANAPSNISGESYILNFDYFYNQKLLDRDEVEPKRLEFIEDVSKINLQIQEKEKERRNLENSLVALESDRNTYTELVETAKELKSQALGYFEELTGKTYEEYKTEHTTLEEDDQLTEEQTIYNVLAKLYVNSVTINNYAGILTNVEQEYWTVRKQLRGSENYNIKIWVSVDGNGQEHIFVELNDYLPGFTFTIGENSYTSTVSKKFFDIDDANEDTIIFTPPQGFSIDPTEYQIIKTKTARFKILSENSFDGVEDVIEDLYEQKKELVKEFNNTYRRFIQEGTWNSTDYVDPELYYLDAYQVSNTSAQPVLTYTIDVVEISQLEGFEWYLFDAGDKSYVEDTEFFGWVKKEGVLTPAREEVIVSEVEWHLEDPSENVIKVQNYKTRFEDFFQRVNATVQTVQYNDATYAKISTLLDADGTIRQDVLLDSLNNMNGKPYTLTSNGSVMIDGDTVLIQNLQNLANRVIINSEGIKVSSDGGEHWTTAIDGQGINIGAVYTGTLNTNEIIIGNRDNPSFRWDKSGISAFKFDETNTEAPYDLQTFVRFDQYGLYGIEKDSGFKARNLADVENNAKFAVTWNGFFIRNKYTGGGRVEITSDNDFRVLSNGDSEKIKIGALEWMKPTTDTVIDNTKTYYKLEGGKYVEVETPSLSELNSYYELSYEPVDGVAPSLYGIRIKNNDGVEVMKTDDNGDLTIVGTIDALAANFSQLVTVGKNDDHVSNWISIDGTTSEIYSSDYKTKGTGWIIDKDGNAVFDNITARGTIKTSVFEYSEIQAVGGIFLFRPSSRIKSAERSGNNIIITVDNPYLFKDGDWCKVSKYLDSDIEPTDADVTSLYNGLSHVYQITRLSGQNSIILNGAAAMIEGDTAVIDEAAALIGGSLIDMGDQANGSGQVGNNNYGIGINSSDNTVDLPPRAISLFETTIDGTEERKVGYNFRGILGTLPPMNSGVNQQIYQNMQGTQGIYTNNMYIGDENRYIAYYNNGTEDRLDIKGNIYIGNELLNNAVNIEGDGAISLGNVDSFHIYIDGRTKVVDGITVPTEEFTYGLGFYETSHIPYRLTNDTTVVSGKQYYNSNYESVTPQTQNPKEEGLYEKVDKRIAYINQNKLSIPYTVVLRGMELGDYWIWELQEDTSNLTLKWTGGKE